MDSAAPNVPERVPGSGPPAKWPTPRTLARWLLVALALYCVGWLLYTSRTALTPFVIGLVLAYLLMPLVNRLSSGMPRWAAILVVYVFGFGLLIGIIAYIAPLLIDQTGRLFTDVIPSWYSERLPRLLGRLNSLLLELRSSVSPEIQEAIDEGVGNAVSTVRANLVGWLTNISTWVLDQVLSVINTLTFLLGFAIVPFWLFYVLLDHKKAGAFLDNIIPRPIRTDVWNIVGLVDRNLTGYIRGQLFLGLVVGVVAGIGLFILDLLGFEVDFILLLAIIAGVTELIPIIGPLLGAVPAVIVGLTHSWQTGLAVAILYFMIQQLENQFLVPRVVGDSLDVHPAVLMVALVIGSQVMGLLGIILSAPVTAIARDVFLYLYNRLKDPPAAQGAATPVSVSPPDLRPLVAPPGGGEQAAAPLAQHERTASQ